MVKDVDRINKKLITIMIVFLVILVNFNIGMVLSATSTSKIVTPSLKKIDSRPTYNILRDFFIWILKILGLYDEDEDTNDNEDPDGNDGDNDPKPTSPEMYTKGYDIFTNTYGDRMIRFHGVLEKTGTAGTGVA
ncbi:MAG: hypothetical protein ACOC5T_09875, partial [Elusimicrobiota bacterium]